MKKEKNNGIAKRIVIIVSLCLALLIALGAFSFAWIRNYGDVGTATITTGKMLYSIKMYRVQDGEIKETVPLFDTTENGKDAQDSEIEGKTLTTDISATEINVNKAQELFFVVEKHEDSIDFDVSMSFDNTGLADASKYDSIGSINYQLYDDVSDSLKNASDIETYVKSDTENQGDQRALSTIWGRLQETHLEGSQKYACIRLKLDSNANVGPDFPGGDIPFRIKFCVAQKDKLPEGGDQTQVYYVDNDKALYDAMQAYSFNDEIVITQSIDYKNYGDLIFTRPCKLTLIRSTLEITGNLSFSYMYDGASVLDTVSDGHIVVKKNSSDAAGNFRIDLPNAKIELKGANNDAANKADIYVEGEFSANASVDDGFGINFMGARVCSNDEADALMPLLVNNSSRINISNRTKVGKITANSACSRIVIVNNGYIDKIDLSKMKKNTSYRTTPVIDIDNYGTVGTVNRAEDAVPLVEDGDVILLPDWSKKFDENDTASGEDNTRIKANKGSSKILAIIDGRTFDIEKDTVNNSNFFFSLGDKEESGYRDDIEYDHRKVFVDTVNGDNTNIIIHYEAPSAIVKRENTELAGLTTLKSYVDYYAESGDIAPVDELKQVKIICYGNKVLTAPPLVAGSTTEYETGLQYDYNFIKEMEALTTLDLSDAVSENNRVPDNAFKGMAALTSVKMSESDTVWGQFLFTDTLVDEITFPQALTKLDNLTTRQNVLDGIRYVHTAITIVDGIFIDTNATQYYFTPDEYTYNAYRTLKNNSYVYWNSKVFLDTNVTRHGEFFLRLYPETKTCEVVAYTGGVELDQNGKVVLKSNKANRVAWFENNNYGFNFNTIDIGKDRYTITSYDAFALFEKLICEENLNITLLEQIKYIGEYAFACFTNVNTTIGLSSVKVEGNPEIMGNAFAYNDALVSFSAPELTSLKGGKNLSNNNVLETVYMPKLTSVESGEDLAKCPKLKTVDISVIEKTPENSSFYTSDNSYTYARFYIHTENAKDKDFYEDALAADRRYIFVNQTYADLYKKTPTYTGVADIGDNGLSDIISADINGNDITDDDVAAGKQIAYYYVINGSDAQLVACLLSKIDQKDTVYTTIDSFNHEGTSYCVSKIGSAAYHFTDILAKGVRISDKVTEIDDYAFYVYYDSKEKTKFYEKFCITLDLNNVKTAGKYAFYYMDMARVTGEYLEEIGEETLSQNKNLIVANLPNLIRSREAGKTDIPYTVFVGCDQLRIAYTSASDGIIFDNTLSRSHSYLRFVNGKNATDNFQIANVNTVIIGSATPNSSFNNNYVNDYLNEEGELLNVYFSDYYDYSVNLKGMTENIRLPGYAYYREQNNELTLFAVSPDIEYGINYTTPNELLVDGTVCKITKLGKYAYGAISMKGVKTFTVAESVKVLDVGALSGSGYDSYNLSNLVTLFDVELLNLSNVEEVKSRAFYKANIVYLNAPALKNIGEKAFDTANDLLTVELPSYETAGQEAFTYCTKIQKITLGKNAKMLSKNMFYKNSSLTEIYILNETNLIEVENKITIIDSAYANNVLVYVPAARFNDYKSTFANGMGGIKSDNFRHFGSTSKINGLTYYWNEITKPIIDTNGIVKNPNDCTAYIDYVEGTLPTSLTLPSTFTANVAIPDAEGNPTAATVSVTYTVVSVSANTMKVLSNVTSVTLPEGMKYLTFNTADIAPSVTALSINNDYFKTVNGVLYTADGSTLLVYPRGKSTVTNFTVGSGVTEIAYRAFYGANIETLTVSGSVTVRDQAFESATGINAIDLTSGKTVTFAGRDTFLGANTNLVINKNGSSVNILTDYSILEKIK